MRIRTTKSEQTVTLAWRPKVGMRLVRTDNHYRRHIMKLLTAAIVLGFAVCLSGCQSLIDSLETSLAHMGGQITESDVAADLFCQHIKSANSQIIIIDYSLLTAVCTYELNTSIIFNALQPRDPEAVTEFSYIHGDQPGDPKIVTEYKVDIPGGKADALSMLQVVLASNYFSEPGIMNSMAVLLCSAEASMDRQVYKLDREGLPIYVVSSESVAGGAVQHDVLSSNILTFASAQSSNHLFPFELPKDYRYELKHDDPINEYRAYKKAWRGLLDAWMTVEESNDYLRKEFPKIVSVSWPRLLFPAGEESDVLLLSWRNYQGRPRNTGLMDQPVVTLFRDFLPVGYHDVPTSTPRNRCSRISGKDGVVYYCKTMMPNYQADLQDELTKMNAEYQRAAATQH